MTNKILFVDDDVNMLASTKRMLGKQFHVTTATSGEEAMEILEENGPFAVIVSDLLMDGMDGFHFLSQANKLSPESACIMLTGHANLQASLKAVNEMGIFRFLTKPCKNHIFFNAVSEGVHQYERNLKSQEPSPALEEPQEIKRVLIVDDNPEFLSLVAGALRPYRQLEVLTADHGAIALKLLNTLKTDLVITDLDMPVMDGMALLAHISRTHSNLPAILFSWSVTEKMEREAATFGEVICLEKPPDLIRLPERILTTLNAGPRGIIDGISTTAFLQMIEMEEKTCTLTVRSSGRSGTLYLYKGRLLSAVTDEKTGEDAAFEIINWDNAEIEIDNACKKTDIEIENPLMQILMEAARLKDDMHEFH